VRGALGDQRPYRDLISLKDSNETFLVAPRNPAD
jgi:hypothetical protein